MMFRADAVEMLGAVAAIIIGLGFFALLAYFVYLFVYKRIQMRHETRLELIKQGHKLPVEQDSYGSLKAGIVSTAVGLGLLIGVFVHASNERHPVGGEIVFALVPLFVGLGLILFHVVWARRGREDGAGEA
jgi:hypothetical protein